MCATRAQPASGRVHREQLSPRRQRARAGGLSPNVTRSSPSRRRCSSPSYLELYMAARPSPLHESMRARQVRVARAKTRTAHRPDRPVPHSLACVAERAAADHTSSAQRRADELLAAGASRTSSRTTTQPMARSAPAQRASSSARCRGGDHHRGTIEACGACGSCAEVPSAGMCGCVGGLDAGGVVFGDSTAHAALGGGWGAAVEERVSATCVTDQLCTKYSQHEPPPL